MPDVEDLQERLCGQRFFDRERNESFTVVGVTAEPSLALLQYDDGVAWDEGTSNFAVTPFAADQARLEADGLDSERYHPLGPGPRIDQICDVEEHRWHPPLEYLWPGGPPTEVREQLQGHPRSLYNEFVRCKRCGLSGEVASEYGSYADCSGGRHTPPWFCSNCRAVYPEREMVYHDDNPYCPSCVPGDE